MDKQFKHKSFWTSSWRGGSYRAVFIMLRLAEDRRSQIWGLHPSSRHATRLKFIFYFFDEGIVAKIGIDLFTLRFPMSMDTLMLGHICEIPRKRRWVQLQVWFSAIIWLILAHIFLFKPGQENWLIFLTLFHSMNNSLPCDIC